MNTSFCALILAAGKGTRMHSSTPKVLRPLLGEPMLTYVYEALKPVFDVNILTLVGYGADSVRAAFPWMNFAEQAEFLGTGHALACALPVLKAAGMTRVLVVNGDMPLLTPDIINTIIQGADGADVAVASVMLDNVGSYGRIIRKNGTFVGIVEAKDYNEAILGRPTGEINAGVYVLDINAAERLLPRLNRANNSGEYYITDLAALALKDGLNVRAVPCGRSAALLGVNSPAELAAAEESIRASVTTKLLASGVHIHFPNQAVIAPRTIIEPGAEIYGPCHVYGTSHIGSGAVVEAFCHLKNTTVEGGATVHPFCHFENAVIKAHSSVGPYTRLRTGAVVEEHAKAGNFVEMKKATLGQGSKASHLTYLGDAVIGAQTNIGAGTVICNYDGVNKHKTTIGAHSFIGSNSSLVAPLTIGDNALIGAGSVITKNVPSDTLAVARGKQTTLPRRKKND